MVFFDFLNWFMVYYTETEGIIINCIVTVFLLISICLSIYFMARTKGYELPDILKEFGFLLIVQIISVGVGIGLTILLAVIFDACGRSMSWLSSSWLLFGLYFCPLYFCSCLGPALYMKFRKTKTISLGHQVQLLLHSQSLFLGVILITLTIMNIRSAFIVMITLFFYTITSLINTASRLQNRDSSWIYIHVIGQIMPIMFYCSLAITAFGTFLALTARSGNASNPDILIAGFSVFLGLLIGGLLVPLCLLSRHPLTVAYLLGSIVILSIILMATPLGFPYTEGTVPQRYFVQHVHQKVNNANGTVATKSGYYLHPMDKHADSYFDGLFVCFIYF